MPPHFPRASRWCWLLLAALPLLTATAAEAGGGPENVFLVVNPTSAASRAVANAYIHLRRLAPINVFMLPWEGSTEGVPIGVFREEILTPILKAIDGRRLSTQIDHIVYSTDFPWRVDFAAELPPQLVGKDQYPSGSLTGLTMLYTHVIGGNHGYLDVASNHYYRPVDGDGIPVGTIGFRSWYGWGRLGELYEAGGTRYLLATMLGVSAGRGNSVREILTYLEAAAGADGSQPPGTVYLVQNKDVRSTTRSGAFVGVARELGKLRVACEIVPGSLPVAKRDVIGLTTGVPDFDWPASGSRVLPGAICENLTSYGAIFTKSAGQTPLSAFLRAGAAGSSGTVTEPYALQAKFPHPGIHVHYARGANLAEAFYQAVQAPYQLLVVGDPLCQPWARIPDVEVVTKPDLAVMQPGQTVSGQLLLEPRAHATGTNPVDRFELFVDGVRIGHSNAGDPLPLDTATLADGHHEIRVVAIDSSPVETQGRAVLPISTSNHGRELVVVAEPAAVALDGSVKISVVGKGVETVTVFASGRVLGRIDGAVGAIDVPGADLGLGTVTIMATGRAGSGATEAANAIPVLVTVGLGR
ncbi:MAG: hypothetical protein EBR86_16660 [Planctomycetia bacterium]|nr:hypothetical protein [Planctomycetia bacterium]